MSWFLCPALQPQDTLCSLAASTRLAGQCCELVGLITACFSVQSLADICEPPQEPSGTFKREAAAFSFKELLFCLQLKCCCSSLLGGKSRLQLCDYATSDWSPWGTIINTLLRQPNNPGSISSVLLLHGKGMVLAQPGTAHHVPLAVPQGMVTPCLPLREISELDTSRKLFPFPQSIKLLSTRAESAYRYFSFK